MTAHHLLMRVHCQTRRKKTFRRVVLGMTRGIKRDHSLNGSSKRERDTQIDKLLLLFILLTSKEVETPCILRDFNINVNSF